MAADEATGVAIRIGGVTIRAGGVAIRVGGVAIRIGGVGIRRGRRNPDEVLSGESLDFWRVETVEKDRLMRLRAEMKVPGKAWLQFESLPQNDGKTLLIETAYFAPRGIWGFVYWYAMWPFHAFLFNGLIRRLAARARMLSRSY